MKAGVARPYEILAAGYDAVMAHVDYPAWAAHAHNLLRIHHPGAVDLLELGCGTGALARELQPLGPPPAGFRYRATDLSSGMLARARETLAGLPVLVEQIDFREIPPDPKADAVVLLYDGLNYLVDPEDLRRLFAGVAGVLRPGGVMLFDQSTPANSRRPEWDFSDEGDTEAYHYERTSRYDSRSRLHTTRFRLRLADGSEVVEEHVQRAYTLSEIRTLLAGSPLNAVAAYDGFSLKPARRRASERIHWVARYGGGPQE